MQVLLLQLILFIVNGPINAMIIKFIFAIIFSLFITVFGHYFIYTIIFKPLFIHSSPVFLTTFIGFCALTFLGFLLVRILPHFLRKAIEFVMFTWMGAMFILFLLCAVSFPIQIYFYSQNLPQKPLSLAILFVGVFLILYSIFQALRQPSIIQTSVPLPSTLPESVENLEIVVLSDIHVSGLIGSRKMKKLVQRVNAIKPDFIFMTGDLMDGSLRQLKKEIDPLRHLKAKQKIIYITGNHEYYSGPLSWKNHFDKVFGWHVLCNSSTTLEVEDLTLNILGVEDKHWLHYEKISRKQDQRLNTSVEHLRRTRESQETPVPYENCLNIFLAHQPKDAKYLKSYPWINLQISGHTHGGQIWPIKYLVLKDQKYNKGLYQIRPNQCIYVNQGTGFWGPPMRLGTQCEITLMRFKRQPSAS